MLDLTLSEARCEAPCEDGITADLLGAGGRPVAQLLQPLFAGVCLQRALHIVWKGCIMGTVPSGKNKTRGVMLNDHVGKILERWFRPKILQIEPLLVTRSQAIGSARRGAVMTQFAPRVFFDVARIRGLSAAAVFCVACPLPTSVVRQYVVGTDLPEQRLQVLMDILGLKPCAEVGVGCLLVKSAGLSPAWQQLVRDMNEDTWFKLDGSGKVTGMFGRCRPGEPIADLVFVFMFGKVLKEVRSVLMETEYGWTLSYDEHQFVEARARRHTAQETEEAHADDCVCLLRHEDPQKLLARLRRGMGSQSTSVWRRLRRC